MRTGLHAHKPGDLEAETLDAKGTLSPMAIRKRTHLISYAQYRLLLAGTLDATKDGGHTSLRLDLTSVILCLFPLLSVCLLGLIPLLLLLSYLLYP